MHLKEIVPSASALVHSLRGLGYSPETALADLIDNSISAGASRVDIEIDWRDANPVVAILDDGSGLDQTSLADAMCFGGSGPLAARSQGDLGRFGLGLKTASLSQCRRMTVVSRRDGEGSMLAWDVDIILAAKGKWHAVVPDAIPQVDLAQSLLRQQSGTLVVWERIDETSGLFGLDKQAFFLRIQDIRAHLAMVFHRYLGGDAQRLIISVNGRPLRPWDPFQRIHPATISMPTERIRHAGATITLTPYVLPHRDRFPNDSEYENAGGLGGWGERQGFYVYRSRRLVVAGGWLGLGGARAWTRDESSRLARLCLDLPTEVDAEWRIDVRKSIARPPGALRTRLTGIAASCRSKAREVFAWRGGGARARTAEPDGESVWIARQTAGKTRYQLNRQHPATCVIAEALKGDRGLLEAYLAIVEQAVPVERIWLDVSDAGGADRPSLPKDEISALAPHLASLVLQMSSKESVEVRLEALLRQLPVDSGALRTAILGLLKANP